MQKLSRRELFKSAAAAASAVAVTASMPESELTTFTVPLGQTKTLLPPQVIFQPQTMLIPPDLFDEMRDPYGPWRQGASEPAADFVKTR